MNKHYQRTILIMAVLISGLTYVLMRWQEPDPREPVPSITLSETLDFGETLNPPLSQEGYYTVMVLAVDGGAPLVQELDTVMGGLVGFQDKLRTTVLITKPEDTEAHYHAQFPAILLLPLAEQQAGDLLFKLRQCQSRARCQEIAETGLTEPWLYVLDDQRSLVYIGNLQHGLVSVVSDLRKSFAAWMGR